MAWVTLALAGFLESGRGGCSLYAVPSHCSGFSRCRAGLRVLGPEQWRCTGLVALRLVEASRVRGPSCVPALAGGFPAPGPAGSPGCELWVEGQGTQGAPAQTSDTQSCP